MFDQLQLVVESADKGKEKDRGGGRLAGVLNGFVWSLKNAVFHSVLLGGGGGDGGNAGKSGKKGGVESAKRTAAKCELYFLGPI